jgi:luciferase family oxidoreductase group 1
VTGSDPPPGPITGRRAGTAPAPLSIADLSTVGSGDTPTQALAASTELAIAAERWGYHRYWVAEHHGMPGVAGSSPAVLLAHLGAHTRTLRLGSGGVMLPNHAPLAVAEQFGLLEALHPGRIDLGIGRAPGGDQTTAGALRRRVEDDFPAQLADLTHFLDADFLSDHPYRALAAVPRADPRPPIWILGSTPTSAALAARLGLPYACSYRVNAADPDVAALDTYRNHFRAGPRLSQPYTILAVTAVAAIDEHQALRLARTGGVAMIRLRRAVPEPAPLPTPDQARDCSLSTAEAEQLDRWLTGLLLGDPVHAAERLEALRLRSGAQELMITTHIHGRAARRRSYELLAHSYGLTR